MTVLFVLVPMALVLAGGAVLAFLWAARDGQMDDLTTPALRILHEDGPAPAPTRSRTDEPRPEPGARRDGEHT
jgi:cbb3-type cytochrome oxidase maturation protein